MLPGAGLAVDETYWIARPSRAEPRPRQALDLSTRCGPTVAAMSFVAVHRTVHRILHAGAEPADVFPLLCPVREREWIDGWDADVLHAESGHAELGCVFVARLAGGHEATYVVTRYEPPRAIAFAIFHGAFVETLLIELVVARG